MRELMSESKRTVPIDSPLTRTFLFDRDLYGLADAIVGIDIDFALAFFQGSDLTLAAYCRNSGI